MEPKHKFKVGDKVVVYDSRRLIGKVTSRVEQNGMPGTLFVEGTYINGQPFQLTPHHKQCRLLKKKERRRVWIYWDDINTGRPHTLLSDTNIPNYVEFVEVKKK